VEKDSRFSSIKDMMEEVSDDTNGESSFEFVSGKIDENSSKDDCLPVAPSDQFLPPSSSFGEPTTQYPVPVPNLSAPTFPVTSKKTESNITFYDPQDSKPVMLPPLIPQSPSSQVAPSMPLRTQSQFSPVQESFSSVSAPSQTISPQTFQVQPTQQPYFIPPSQHSSLNLPVESAGPEVAQQQSDSGVWG